MIKQMPDSSSDAPSLFDGLANAARRVFRPRKAPRHSTALPVTISSMGVATGIVMDMSASGVLVRTEADTASWQVGLGVLLSVEFSNNGGKSVLECAGEIVRVETEAGRVLVGVKVTRQSVAQVN